MTAASIGVLGASATLAAHVPAVVPPDRLWRSWTFEPVVICALALAVWLYGRGVVRAWARAGRGRVVSRAHVLSFAGGVAALGVALVSPLEPLGGTLLSAHMVQHGLLAGAAPPLLLLGRPGAVFAWGLRPVWTVDSIASRAWRGLIAASGRLSTPAPAAALHAVLLWLWHAPALFGAAVAHDWVHAVQHVSFMVPSLFLWRALVDASSPRRAAIASMAAFLTFMHTGLLGGLLTMAPEPLYGSYGGRTELWGLSALEDQQLAGVLMWVPMGLPYLAVGLWLASRLLSPDVHDGTPRAARTSSRAAVGPEIRL